MCAAKTRFFFYFQNKFKVKSIKLGCALVLGGLQAALALLQPLDRRAGTAGNQLRALAVDAYAELFAAAKLVAWGARLDGAGGKKLKKKRVFAPVVRANASALRQKERIRERERARAPASLGCGKLTDA
jgi:hypothetical protein